MLYIEAPVTTKTSLKSIFIAGSITGCPDWQKDLIGTLKNLDIAVYNPRRKNFPMNDPSAAEGQIKWEYDHLRKADAISFWFSKETLGPIVLFELGAHSSTDKPIVIGVEPGYPRENDILIQMKLIRPDIPIVRSLDKLSEEIFKLMNQIMQL